MNSISDSIDYRTICKLAAEDDNFFKTFKSHPSYNSILEHVSTEQGSLYIKYLDENFPNFMDRLIEFKNNDLHGGTKMSRYDVVGDISPTTLRYIKVLYELNHLFGDLTDKKIVEIGSGYGGQCFITRQIFKFYEYALLDLDEALLLSNRYLNELNINHRIIKIEQISDMDEDFDLVISNYAYSELNKNLQDLYWDKIIRKSKNGYFTLNFISHLCGIDSYSKEEIISKFLEKNPKILQEIPNTFENNMILYF
jgi:putative sugar O-methyltransferase